MSKPVDAEAEVVKLQELVRKLQKQNEVLRNKTQEEQEALETTSTGSCSSVSLLSPSVLASDSPAPLSGSPAWLSTNNSNCTDTNVGVNRTRPPTVAAKSQPDDDTASTCSGGSSASRRRTSASKPFEEDNWLYRSPKQKTTNDLVTAHPIQWMRDIFDLPCEDVTPSKGSLLCHLHGLKVPPRISASGSSPALYQLNRNGDSQCAHSAEDLVFHGGKPSIKQPLLLHEMGTRVDTNTFTRPKKQRQSVLGRTLTVDPVGYQRSLSHSEKQNAVHMPTSASNFGSGSCDDLDKMKDMTDVRVIARMQEASLKAQVMATGLNAKSRSGSQHSVASSSGSGDTSPPLSPKDNQHVRQSLPEGSRMPRKSLPNLGITMGNRKIGFTPPSVQRSSPARSTGSPARTYRPVDTNGHQRTLSTPMKVANANSGQYANILPVTGRRGSTGIPRPAGSQPKFFLTPNDTQQRRSPSPMRVYQNTVGHE